MKAAWIKDYDGRMDELYDCPGCPKCSAPAFSHEKVPGFIGYHCPSCGEDLDLDEEMLKWKEDRMGSKIEVGHICINCGKRDSVLTYHKNHKKEWVVWHGQCLSCGAKFIV